MIVSKDEALYHIQHAEQQYEWGEISKTALKEKLDYFPRVLFDYDYGKYVEECERINRKYGFDL